MRLPRAKQQSLVPVVVAMSLPLFAVVVELRLAHE